MNVSTANEWLPVELVAAYLGDPDLATDSTLIQATGAVRSYLESVSPYLVVDVDTGEVLMVVDSVQTAGILWSAHAYQTRSAPSGFAGYGEGVGDTMMDLSLASNRADIWRFAGIKRPVVF